MRPLSSLSLALALTACLAAAAPREYAAGPQALLAARWPTLADGGRWLADDDHSGSGSGSGEGSGSGSGSGSGEGHGSGHESSNLFALGEELSLPKLGVCLCALILFTVCFEISLHLTEEGLKERPIYMDMLQKAYRELMILGFVSFLTTLVTNLGWVGHGEWLEAFELAHLAIFFVALVFILEAVLLAQVSRLIKARWDRIDNQPFETVIANAAAAEASMSWLMFRLTPAYEAAEYHVIKSLFFRANRLPASFDYTTYLRRSLGKHIVDITEVSVSSWVFMMAIFGAMTGLYYVSEVGDGLWVMVAGGVSVCGGLLMLLLASVHALTRAMRLVMGNRGNSTVTDAITWVRDNAHVDDVEDLDQLRESIEGHAPHEHNPLDDDVVKLISKASKKALKVADKAATSLRNVRPSLGAQGSGVELSDAGSEDDSHASVHDHDGHGHSESRPPPIDLDQLFIGGNSRTFKRGLDLLLLGMCFLMSLLISHFVMLVVNDYRNPGVILVFLFVPSIFAMVVFAPIIVRNWVMIMASGHFDYEVVSIVLEHMEEMEVMRTTILNSLKHKVARATGRDPGSPEELQSMLEDAYDDMDVNGDGTLSYSELRHGLRRHKIFMSQVKFNQLRRIADKDHSGNISRREFVALLSQSPMDRVRAESIASGLSGASAASDASTAVGVV